MFRRDEQGRYRATDVYLALTDEERAERKRAQHRAAAKRYAERHPERIRALRTRGSAKHREARLARTRAHQQRNSEAINAAKDVPCLRCGGRFPPVAMDLHHRDPASKSHNASCAVGHCWGEKRLLAEIAKCDVLCACCHRIVTNEQRQQGV